MAEIVNKFYNTETKRTNTFRGSIQQFVRKCKDQEDKFLREFVQDLLQVIVTGSSPSGSFGPGTPVDTGFARASWYIGVNDNGSPPALAKGAKVDWSSILAQSVVSLSNAKIGDTIWLMNNCVYIRRLEYGHSQQAPQGMVRVTLANYKAIADATAKRILK